ncbi:hypothetical protein [Cupriavidus sp. YR651]|uniref:hypothetical protein n=1 Tax=Cupriavidus sp. YR651 TaxID=1855315 RepID=UPI00115FC48F|nr:hypothetical protein [Cupriavidus sp. YR651]
MLWRNSIVRAVRKKSAILEFTASHKESMTRRLLLTATTSVALLLGSAFPAHSMTAQDAHNKLDDISFEAFARAAAYHCGDKSFGDDFVRHSKRYVKALYPAGSEQKIAKVSVARDVVAINRADCPGMISQMKDLKKARDEELKEAGKTFSKLGKAPKS